MSLRVFSILLVVCVYSFSYTLQEAKKLKYLEQTPQNISKYKTTLESLISKDDLHATYMLGLAYETGSHWDKDIDKAIELYKVLSKKNYKDVDIKLGTIFMHKKMYTDAKIYLKKSIKQKNDKSLLYLLEIAIYEQNKKDIKKYFKLCRKNNIILDDFILEEIKKNNVSLKTLSEKMEDKTFEAAKDYIVMVLKTVKSSKSMIKNLGFRIEEYTISYSTDPTISVMVYRTNNKIDEEMAQYLAKDNILKQSIFNALSFVNELEPYLAKDVEQKLKWIRFEVGAHSNVKITTKEMY